MKHKQSLSEFNEGRNSEKTDNKAVLVKNASVSLLSPSVDIILALSRHTERLIKAAPHSGNTGKCHSGIMAGGILDI